MSRRLGNRIQPLIATAIGTPFAVFSELWRASSKRIRLTIFHQRGNALRILAMRSSASDAASLTRPKVLVVISHITTLEEAGSLEDGSIKITRLRKTIDGLLTSLAHCDLHIIVNTVKQQHITSFLPQYQKQIINIREQENCDPMFVGFKAQQEFTEHSEQFDWFMFMEDDIIIHDSDFLEKLASFNENSGLKEALLLPNRYEMWNGTKTYIDTTNHNTGEKFAWNNLSALSISDRRFAECENAHAALYCLSKMQLYTWVRCGRSWYNKVTLVGPLESAATGCLFECFSLYKPHPANPHYLEVEHGDTKYAPLIQQAHVNSTGTQSQKTQAS